MAAAPDARTSDRPQLAALARSPGQPTLVLSQGQALGVSTSAAQRGRDNERVSANGPAVQHGLTNCLTTPAANERLRGTSVDRKFECLIHTRRVRFD